MKLFTFLILLFLSPISIFGQIIVEHQGISKTNIDVSNKTTLTQVTINPASAGKAIVHFDGTCISTPGDRIILAASNTTSWSPNDGNIGVEAIDNDINQNSFSHTRVYDVNPGSQTFYAVAENLIETDGTGLASVYGSLTVEFIPNNSVTVIEHEGINKTNLDVSNKAILNQVTINPASAGKAIVHFDGTCISTPGDRIILAASNTTSWSPNDGNIGVEAIDNDINQNSFSHTRVYDVNPGSQTFYAVAENIIETDGTGLASVYGSLTVEFIPNNSVTVIEHEGINKTNLDVSNKAILNQVTINPASAGKAIVHFDGTCISTPGDRIILAASNTTSWSPNDGNIGVEAIDNDINQNSFSHTRVYDVNPGTQTFYAVAENLIETDGTGLASVYGSLTVEFIPNEIVNTINFFKKEQVLFYPNPTNGIVNISKPKEYSSKKHHLKIIDDKGNILRVIKAADLKTSCNILSNYPDGIYYFQLLDDENSILSVEKIIKTN